MASVRLTDSLRDDIKYRLLDKGGYFKVIEPILNEIMPNATTVHPVGIPIADFNTMFGLNKEQNNGS